MTSWFSRLFSSEKDPIIEHLVRDPDVFDSIKTSLQQIDQIPESAKLRATIIHIAEKLVYILQGQKLHRIEKSSVETNLLSNFLVPLLSTFQLIPPTEASSVSIIHAVYTIFIISPTIPPLPIFSRSFIHLILVQSQYPALSSMADEIEMTLLNCRDFTVSLCNPSFFLSCVSELFPLASCMKGLEMFSENLSNIFMRIYPEQSFDFTQAIEAFQQSLICKSTDPKNIGISALIFSMLLYMNSDSNYSFSGIDLKGLLNLIHDNLISEYPIYLSKCIYILANTPRNTLNKTVHHFIFEKVVRNPTSAASVLVMLKTFNSLMKTKQFDFSEYELIFPLHSILAVSSEYQSDEVQEEILKIFLCFADQKFNRIMFCLQPILQILSNKILRLSGTVFNALVKLANGYVTIDSLIDSGFFKLFLDDEIFGQLVKNFPDFVTLLRNCYKEADDNIHWKVLSMLLSTEDVINHPTKFSQLCASFLSAAPSAIIVKKLMEYTSKNPKESLISIFISSFIEEKNVGKMFIQTGGLNWINCLVENQQFPEHLFSVFFSSLLHYEAFEEVNEWVTSLPLSHPIFNLEKPMVYHIVFGTNALVPNALRLPALLPLLPAPNVKLSPHAICKASQSAMKEFIRHGADLDNNPLVVEMANRYLSSAQFTYLLKNSRNISAFCNTSGEHFQLFEMAPGSRDSAFTITRQYHSLSFWIKIETDQSVLVNVLHTDLCNLQFSNNSLLLIIGDKQESLPLEPKTWSLVTLSYIHDHPKSTFVLTCNTESIKMSLKASPPELSNATFGSFETICLIRWFIGSSVRLFNTQAPHAELLKHGPGSITPIADEKIYTPNSKTAKKGVGVLSVPYCGFPWFFFIRKHMIDAIEEILKSDDQKRVYDIVNAMLNSFIIFPNISDFWLQIKTIIKEKREIFTNEMIEKILTIFVSHIKDDNEFSIMYNDIDIWYLYENSLIKVLLDVLKTKKKICVNPRKVAASITTMMNFSSNKAIYVKCLSRLGYILNNPVFYTHIYHYFISTEADERIEIINALNDTLLKHYSSCVESVFTFERILDIFSCTDNSLIHGLVNLLVIISSHNDKYIKDDSSLALSLVSELDSRELWIKLLAISAGTVLKDYASTEISYFETLSLAVPEILPTIFSLICFKIIAMIIVYKEEPSEEIKKFAEDILSVIKVMSLYMKNVPETLASNQLYEILLFFTPLIFDTTKLFSESRINESPKSPKKSKVHLQFNAQEVFKIWGLPKRLINAFHETGTILQQNVDSPLISFLLPVINRLDPGIVFQFEKQKEFPTFLIDHIDMISDFYAIFLTSSIIDPSKFSIIMKMIVFDAPVKDLNGYSEFSTRFICSLLCRPQVYSAPIKSLDFLFSSISIEMENHIYGDRPIILISSCLTALKTLYLIEDVNATNLLTSLRHILNSMFDVCTSDDILGAFDILNSMKDFVYKSHLFDEFEFSAVILSRVSTLTGNNDKRFLTFLSNFINIVILGDDFQARWEEYFDSVSCLMLNKYCKGLLSLTNKGPYAYADWIKENQDIYINITKDLEAFHSEFSFTAQDEIVMQSAPDVDNEKIFKSRLIQLSAGYNKHRSVLNLSESFIKQITEFLRANYLNHMLRFTESTSFVLFMKNETANQQNTERFAPKSFRVSSLTLPIRTPRIMAPSYYELPKIQYETTVNPEEFQTVKCDAHPLIDIKTKTIYPKDFTPIISSIGFKILPTCYSGVVTDNGVLLMRSLLLLFESLGKPEAKFNAMYLKYNISINSVVLLFKYAFIVILGASLDPTKESLIYEDTTEYPVLYTNLMQMAMLGLLGNVTLFCGHIIIPIVLTSISYSTTHLVDHKPLGVLINTTQGGDLIITSDQQMPSAFLKAINVSPVENVAFLHTLSLQRATNLWSNGRLTNYEYLLVLNSYGGRSFSDLAQYPVFPWVISDYKSQDYPQQMRDLSLPMGQIGEQRAEIFNITYESQKTHWYGAHYSMAASIHYFLFRVPPFTYFEWDLHQGWDNPDRMFFDMERTWESCAIENTNDVKELTPEFFDFPGFLTDVNGIGIDPVALPPWAKSAEHFVYVNRLCLEDANIENWIDLIFGYEQIGQNAINAKNLFMPILYHTYQFTEYDDPATVSIQLENWGQCPIQIFKKKHISGTKSTGMTSICSDSTLIRTCPIKIDEVPPLTARSGEKSISISKVSCSITFDGITHYDQNFAFASNINVSNGFAFAVVDFSFGLSIVYKLAGIFSSSTIIPFPSFSQEDNVKSRIDGIDMICASFHDNELVMWDFIRTRIHRIRKFEEKIIDCAFDEYFGLIYVLTKSKLSCFSINDVLVAEVNLQKSGCCLFVQNMPESETIRPVFVGIETGDVMSFNFDVKSFSLVQLMTYKLNSLPIVSIEMRDSVFAVYAKSSDGSTFCIYTKDYFLIN